MEAPDKIYAKYHETEIAYGFDIDKYPSEGTIEYVRKDRLMGWLEKELKTLSWDDDSMKTVTHGGGAETYGKIDFCKRVINKLNELV